LLGYFAMLTRCHPLHDHAQASGSVYMRAHRALGEVGGGMTLLVLSLAGFTLSSALNVQAPSVYVLSSLSGLCLLLGLLLSVNGLKLLLGTRRHRQS
jgi:hypothetical protein